MKFRIGERCLHAAMILCLCTPAVAQQQATLPLQPVPAPDALVETPQTVVPQATKSPVIVPEQIVTPRPVRKKGPVDSLKPGQFVWEKRDVYEGPMKIVAVLDIQRLYVFQNDKLIGFTTISTGKKGKETPSGIFNILQKNIDHKSNLYSNAPMPYMQRLTWDGIAMHGGHLPGYPASHGCIRLPPIFAKALFGVTELDQEVVVLKDIFTPVKRPVPKPAPIVDPGIIPQPSPAKPEELEGID
jgi:lipoprotein-anchoring transpeptidase ErfK/SrfK